jgi:hypothetical protein
MSDTLTAEQEDLVDKLMKNPVGFIKESGIEAMIDKKFDFTYLRKCI